MEKIKCDSKIVYEGDEYQCDGDHDPISEGGKHVHVFCSGNTSNGYWVSEFITWDDEGNVKFETDGDVSY